MIFFYRKFSLNKLKLSIRSCSSKSKTSDEHLNTSLKFFRYQPKHFELKDVTPKQDPSWNSQETFSMIFPPPNITGNLHLGHSLTATIQDVLVRWKHKQHINTRWIPGTDHAGIATEVVVEKILHKQLGKTRHEIGREAFLAEVWKWKNEQGSSITKDLKALGTSLNWDKEYFTMDENLCNAVNEAFIRLFEKGLIYRDDSLVNWSCSLESAISDIEVDQLEIHGKTEIAVPNYDKNVQFGIITKIAYKVVNSSEEVIVTTTRPETLLGDVAVAVHTNDNRYSHLSNAQLWHPFRKEAIPLIFDESVDPEFGTGAVKIAPAHDKNDFDVAKRHKLSIIQVINEKGFIIEDYEQFAGLPRFIARDKILHCLAELDLYRGSTFHNMVLPICSRSKDVIELLLRPQWFVRCEEMSRKACEVVKNKELKIHPQNFEKEWFRWLTNSRDWCISRQLWWGHQIPAYKVTTENGESWVAAKSSEEAEKKFKEKNPNVSQLSIVRDQDVLDTWFSSALLPFSAFGWPNTNEDCNKFFPLSLLETRYDILFIWVTRMVMLSMELTGKLPFKEVLLHGIVCDFYGRKMSKSLGNVLRPEQIINGATLGELQRETEADVVKGILGQAELEKSLDEQRKMFPYGIKDCGTDALRFTLLSQNIKQQYISFYVAEAFINKKFLQKIFNATKFVVALAGVMEIKISDIRLEGLKMAELDRWLLSRLGKTVKTVRISMDNYNFHHATAALKSFFLDDLYEVYVETIKSNRFKDNQERSVNCKVLIACIAEGLDYLELFTPFFAQEIKPYLSKNCTIAPEIYIDDEIEKEVETMKKVCEDIREKKFQCKITTKIPSEVQILIKSPKDEKFFKAHAETIKALTFTNDLKLTTNTKEFESEEFVGTSTDGNLCSFGVRTLEKSSGKVDSLLNKKKYVKLENELIQLTRVVSVEGYKANSSEKILHKHKERIEQLKMEIENMRQNSQLY